MQSSYIDEKLKSLQVGFGRAKNIFELKTNPFISPENPVRGPTVISKLLYDIKKVTCQQNFYFECWLLRINFVIHSEGSR